MESSPEEAFRSQSGILRAAAVGHVLAAAVPAHACASCPSSAQSGRARMSAAHCIIDRCSTQAQVLGATGRCIGLSPGASCTIRKHSVCSHRPPRSAPPHARPDRAEHMQREQRKCALNPSERHHRHGMQPRDGAPTTFCQPPCCSCWLRARCSHASTCASCPLRSTARGCARGPAPTHCIARRRLRHDRAGQGIHRQRPCAPMLHATSVGAPARHLQHETCASPRRAHVRAASALKIGVRM